MRYLKLRTQLSAAMTQLDNCIRSCDDPNKRKDLIAFKSRMVRFSLITIDDDCVLETTKMLNELSVGDANECI